MSGNQILGMDHQTLVFTITAGRTGTKFVQQIFGLLPDTLSLHEPEPNFVWAMRRAQQNPEMAVQFMIRHKIPFIRAQSQRNYIETSHLCCKGFVEAILLCQLRSSFILLRRHPRQIATSYYQIDTIPGRTPLGFQYLLSPDDPYVLPLLHWRDMHDYQLCYWYSLEIERRQHRYRHLLAEIGFSVVDITAEDLHDFDTFMYCCQELGIRLAQGTAVIKDRHERLCTERHNPKTRQKVRPIDFDLDQMEDEVWKAIAYYEPLLEANVMARYPGGR